MKKSIIAQFWLLCLLWLPSNLVHSQITGDEIPGASNEILIKGINVKQSPDKPMIRADIYIKNGIIEQIGDDLSDLRSAKVVDGDSLFAYAAFISPLTHFGQAAEPDEARRSAWRGAPGATPLHLAGVTPHNSAYDHMEISESEVAGLHRQGIGIVHSVPRGFVMSGKGCLMMVDQDRSKDQLVLATETGLFAQFRNKMRIYPATPLATMSVWRELIQDTRNQYEYFRHWENNPAGLQRPEITDVQRALFPVVNKSQSVFFNVGETRQILRASRLSEELDFDLVLAHVSVLSPLIMESLKEGLPIIFDLNLPEKPDELKDKKVEQKKEESPKKSKRRTGDQADAKPKEEAEKDTIPVGMDLQEYVKLKEARAKAYRERLGIPALASEQHRFAGFSLLETESKDILSNLRELLNFGLTEDQLLEGLTTQPAALFNIDGILGRVEPGFQAHLVIFDKPFTDKKSTVQYMIIDGNLINYTKD